MVFNTIIFHIGALVIFKLLSTNTTDIEINHDYYISHDLNIARRGSFAVNKTHIFLPGSVDHTINLPRTEFINFHSIEKKNEWLIHYQKAFKTINGLDSMIIDLDEMPETEDAPAMRLA